jgi:hypothetical protein
MSDEQIQLQKMPLKPGKGYGIVALLCGTVGFIVVLFAFLLVKFHELRYGWSHGPFGAALFLLEVDSLALFWKSPLCAFAGIVFGIMGCDTKGRVYAYVGLVLSLLHVPLFFLVMNRFLVTPGFV